MFKGVIIFDGNCGFCNKTIMFIARTDKNNICQIPNIEIRKKFIG